MLQHKLDLLEILVCHQGVGDFSENKHNFFILWYISNTLLNPQKKSFVIIRYKFVQCTISQFRAFLFQPISMCQDPVYL